MSKQKDSDDKQSELEQFTQLAKKLFSSKIENKDKRVISSSNKIRLTKKESS